MTLIKSISGIRGIVGSGLTPPEIVKFTSAYARLLQTRQESKELRVVVGRDARTSGEMISGLVCATLQACGVDVLDIGLATTPTVEMSVVETRSDGGIILTASHNPAQWNALKLLNNKGEFLSAEDGKKLLELAGGDNSVYQSWERIGSYQKEKGHLERHIEKILELKLVDVEAIQERSFRVAFDAVNSVGGIAIPALLHALGVTQVIPLNSNPDGHFTHNPEPLPEHLGDILQLVKETEADVGFVVDPDVDRLAIVCENGEFFGEEYTLVAVSDYVLKHIPGNTVSNLSSSRALKDVTEKFGGQYFASAVGEVNVVEMMKKCHAVIGGEGNGGVIYPPLHYGRDALVGIALFLSYLAREKRTCSELRATYPSYFISKNKLALKEGTEIKQVIAIIKKAFAGYPVNETDGLRVEFEDGWAHLRASNTEPVIRLYTEGKSTGQAEHYANRVITEISAFIC